MNNYQPATEEELIKLGASRDMAQLIVNTVALFKHVDVFVNGRHSAPIYVACSKLVQNFKLNKIPGTVAKQTFKDISMLVIDYLPKEMTIVAKNVIDEPRFDVDDNAEKYNEMLMEMPDPTGEQTPSLFFINELIDMKMNGWDTGYIDF